MSYTPFKMKGWGGYQSPLNKSGDREDGLELLKLNAGRVIGDNPGYTQAEHTTQVDMNVARGIDLLKKSGMKEEEIDKASGSEGWDVFLDYHGLNIM